MEFNAHDVVHPVICGEHRGDRFVLRAIIGTCFSIGKGYFLTCSHVIENKNSSEVLTIGDGNTAVKVWHVINVDSVEQHKEVDVALLYAPTFTRINPRVWTRPRTLPMGSTIHATGFPDALNSPDEGSIQIRALSGTITSQTLLPILKSKPDIYELSFPAPRGLSGSPLIDNSNSIAGVVIGNRSIETTVFTETETNVEGDHTTVYEKVESYRAGIALQSTPILYLHSKLLGCTVEAHLNEQELIK